MSLPIVSFGSGLLLLPILFATSAAEPEPTHALSVTASEHWEGTQDPARYIGSRTCKNCHQGEAKGDSHAKWAKGPHAQAFKTLASDKAKAIAAELKIDDPQKSADCLKCHVTAYEVDKKMKKRGLRNADGVSCESCHGPGENHFKIRMAEAQKGGEPAPVAANEILAVRKVETCQQCHNEESPTYMPFCLKERMKKIQHFDPRKERSAEEIKALEEACSDGCTVCAEKKTDKDGK
jgi:hypothetical protein